MCCLFLPSLTLQITAHRKIQKNIFSLKKDTDESEIFN